MSRAQRGLAHNRLAERELSTAVTFGPVTFCKAMTSQLGQAYQTLSEMIVASIKELTEINENSAFREIVGELYHPIDQAVLNSHHNQLDLAGLFCSLCIINSENKQLEGQRVGYWLMWGQ